MVYNVVLLEALFSSLMSNVFLLTSRLYICLPSIGEDAIYQPSALMRGQNESLLEVVVLYRSSSFPTHHTCLQERSPGVRQHIRKPSLINLSRRCKGYQKPRVRTAVYMKQECIKDCYHADSHYASPVWLFI